LALRKLISIMILNDFLPEKQENQNLDTTPHPGLRPEEGALQKLKIQISKLKTQNLKLIRLILGTS